MLAQVMLTLAVHLAAAVSCLVLLPALASADDPVCQRMLSACSCETASGGKIDLTPLAKSGGFAFTARGPKGEYNYLYNPCYGVKCDNSATDAASCQRSLDLKYEYLLGTQTTAQFDTQPGLGLHIKYSALSGDRTRRSALVQLVCDSSGQPDQFMAMDEGVGPAPIVYHMKLVSKNCCEKSGGGGGGGDGAGGLSGGDILLIVFFSLAVVYLAGGIAVNVFVRGQKPCPDALPNRGLWATLPGLVRDGAVFVSGRIRSAITGRKGQQYESI